jgi:hypothetical protein
MYVSFKSKEIFMNKNALRLPCIVLFSLLVLYSCVLIPLYQFLITDAVWMNSILLDIVDLLCQHVETLGSVALLTLVLFGIYRYRLHGAKQILLIALGALCFKYIAAVIAVSIEFGSIDLTGGLTGFLVAFLIELSILALTAYLAHKLVTSLQVEQEAKKAAAVALDRPFEEKTLYPFQKCFSLKNPLQRILFIGILTVALWRLAAAVISEFAYGVLLQPGDVPVILFYWFILILLPAFYSYFLSLLFFKLCVKQEEKTAANE